MKCSLLSCGVFLALVLPAWADTPEVKPAKASFEILKTGHIAAMVKVNGKGPFRVIFDTGAPLTVFSTKLAKEAEIVTGEQTKVKTLEFGDVKAEDVTALVFDHPTIKALASKLGPIEGLVGFPFFARYRMTIDYQAKEMTFVPNGYEPPDVLKEVLRLAFDIMNKKKPPREVLAPAAQWGMQVAKEEKDEDPGVTIKEVLPGSAAAAGGLKVGDRLLTLDGRWTDSVADTYIAAGYVKPGSTVKLVIQREGKKQELMVTPLAGL